MTHYTNGAALIRLEIALPKVMFGVDVLYVRKRKRDDTRGPYILVDPGVTADCTERSQVVVLLGDNAKSPAPSQVASAKHPTEEARQVAKHADSVSNA